MTNRLIHIAEIFVPHEGKKRVYLRQFSLQLYQWLLEDTEETGIEAQTIELALQKAYSHWRLFYFKTLNCGFRYTLPERDEHGMNALFYQLAASHATSNGIYFDEELGHNCYVQNASDESIQLLRKLTLNNRL